MIRLLRRLAVALAASRAALAIPTIEIKGSKFFTSQGDQFFIKGRAFIVALFSLLIQPGIAYQYSATAISLVNGDQCKIDAKIIACTGANVIRVYSVDPTLQNEACMKDFEEQGIYVICEMTTPTIYINRVRA